MQNAFGSGSLWGIPSGANQTPSRFGVLQNAAVDFKASAKPLFGQNQLPVTVARGTMAISGKAEIARFTARLYNDIFFGTTMSTPTVAKTVVIDNESGTVPGTSTYTVTVTNSSTWVLDLGVVYAATGLPLTRGATATGIGVYSVAAGVYTFASADANAAVKISYTYTASSGATLTIANAAMGVAPTFKTVLSMPYNNNDMVVTLNACVSTSMSITTALEDFTKQAFTFEAFTDSSDTLGTICFSEAI